jgi:hypothetical protein
MGALTGSFRRKLPDDGKIVGFVSAPVLKLSRRDLYIFHTLNLGMSRV